MIIEATLSIIPEIASSFFSDFQDIKPNTIPVAPTNIPIMIRGITHSIKEKDIATIPRIKEILANNSFFII